MLKFLLIFFIAYMVVVLSSCEVKTARVSSPQVLVIASDCLFPKDTNLFMGFAKKNHLSIRIEHLSWRTILKKIRTEKLNTELDAIILSSSYSMWQLASANVLQRVENERIPSRFFSASKKWGGIGIDPYIFVTKDDTLNRLIDYNSLIRYHCWEVHPRKNTEWSPFFAALNHQLMNESHDLKRKWYTAPPVAELNPQRKDSIQRIGCPIFIGNYSKVVDNITGELAVNQGEYLVFPNQESGGTFYNMHCFAIVKQAKNFQYASEFFDYILLESVNKRLNNQWKTFPLFSNRMSIYPYQNTRFEIYPKSPMRLLNYFNRPSKYRNKHLYKQPN